MEEVGGAAVPEGTEETAVSIGFSPEGAVSGNGGCNRCFGTATLTGVGFGIGGVGSTMMACPEPQMQAEQAFQAALAGVDCSTCRRRAR